MSRKSKVQARPPARIAGERRLAKPRRAVEMLRVNTDETAIKWLFHRGRDSKWRWKKTSPAEQVIAESAAAFARYCDCIADAKRAGYRQWLAPRKLKALSFSHVRELKDLKSNRRQSAKPAAARAGPSAVKADDTKRPGDNSAKVVALRAHRIP